MRHRWAPYLALALSLLSARAADARTLTIRQPGAPQVTLTVPRGWTAVERKRSLLLTRGDRRRVVRQCRLSRTERDLRGRRIAGGVPVRGGSCLRGTHGLRVRAVLGDGSPAPESDAAAEALARTAMARTLAQPRARGTAVIHPFAYPDAVRSTFEWDGAYEHQVQTIGHWTAEVIRPGDHARFGGETCWGFTSRAQDDDAFEPRLELTERDVPPSSETAWHVAYQPVASNVVRWTSFVADGFVELGADGLVHRLVLLDHHQARGRTDFKTLDIAYTGFPAAITQVSPTPSC